MGSRALLLRELINDDLYAVDERRVAEAIVARVALHGNVAEPELRNESRHPGVGSFRFDPRARSFRLERSAGARHFRG